MNTLQPDSIQSIQLEEVSVQATPDSIRPRKFSVYRIAQSMPNATPSQLDSAIQANLPPREHFLSTRPDTLNIPGLVGKSPYVSLDSLSVYRQSFFAENSLFHPELEVRPTGYVAHPVPYRLWRDDWITGMVLLIFLMGAFILHRSRKFLHLQAKNFFFPSNEMQNASSVETCLDPDASFLTTLLLSMMGTVLLFGYMQYELDIFFEPWSPHIMLGVFVLGGLLFFFLKRTAYSLINWIFFDKQQRRFFNETYTFLSAVEAGLLFPVVLITVYLNFPLLYCILAALCLIILVKVLLAYKCFNIFFRNLLGSLHIIVYLCALEMVPLVIIWNILMRTVDILIVKF